MPIMCEECKCSNWICPDCGDSNHHDCDCSCCGCKCQTQPTNQTGEETMTMINPEPAQEERQKWFSESVFEEVKADRQRIADSRDAYIEKFNKSQATIRKIMNAIEGDIRELGLTRDDSFPLDTLDDIFEAEGLELSFKRTYEVLVEYKLHAKFKIEADSEEDAISECEQQGIDRIDFDMYAEEEWEEQERNVIEAILEGN